MIDAEGGNKCDDGDAAPSLSVMCVHGSGGPGSKRKDGVSVCARLYVNHFVRVFFIAMPVVVGHSSIHVPRFLSLSANYVRTKLTARSKKLWTRARSSECLWGEEAPVCMCVNG